MLKLFVPQTKVQKNRQIIRDTDMRMAKYSRRGLISNFLIYTLCLVFEQRFVSEHHTLAIVLTGGLLLITLIRGYFLFRIDSIYPKAPAQWRNKYFTATLFGACWWGLILAYVTLYMDMKGEAALMWLYTVVFFSTTAHAFAPYKRFLSIYQFIGLVPAACCTFFIGEYIGAFYGFILLFFYMILNHHCSLMSLNYWERLEAQYNLAKKSESLEAEKRDTRASTQLTKEYIQLLRDKMKGLLEVPQFHGDSAPPSPVTVASQRAVFEKLFHNVDDFKKVLNKEVDINLCIFNVRHYMQSLVYLVVEDAEKKNLELETSLSPALPSRLIGAPPLIGKVFSIMMRSIVQNCQDSMVFIEIEFVREYEQSGELLITVLRRSEGTKRTFFQTDEGPSIPLNLGLVLAKGLTETMGGSLEVDDSGSINEKYLQFRCPLKIAERGARPEYHRLAYKGRPLLLIHTNSRWLNQKHLELSAMGFDVVLASDFKSALQILNDAVVSGKAIQSVVYCSQPKDDGSVQFCNDLLEHNDLKYTQQFVICTRSGQDFLSKRVILISPLIHYIKKPAGFFEFEISFSSVFEEANVNYLNVSGEDQASPISKCQILWIALNKNFEHAERYKTDSVDIQRVGDLKQLNKLLDTAKIQLIIVEYTGPESESCIQHIRTYETIHNRESLLPVISIGPPEAERLMLEQGGDHHVDSATFKGVNTEGEGNTPALDFWIKGGHH